MKGMEDRNSAPEKFKALDLLIEKNEGPCLSLILGMYKGSNRKQNQEILKQGVRKAKTVLNRNAAPARVIKAMVEKLDEIVMNFDPVHTGEGLGIYIAPRRTQVVHFPFPVNDMVLVADSFESRDITYLKQYLRPYYVLSLSKQSIHFFQAHADSLHEIKDENFPLQYQEEYEYASPTRAHSYGSTLKGFEKDKGILTDIRIHSWAATANGFISKYLSDPHHELVLTGMPKLIGDFENHLPQKRNIVGRIPGNFQMEHFQDLALSSWKVCQESRRQKIQQLLKKMEDLPIKFKATGLREIWEAAESGKGYLLLVEKDYRCKAYLPEGSSQIRLRQPKGKFKFIQDAVDDVIEMILGKKGNVLFVPENQLNKMGGIALFLRY